MCWILGGGGGGEGGAVDPHWNSWFFSSFCFSQVRYEQICYGKQHPTVEVLCACRYFVVTDPDTLNQDPVRDFW
jgi:hypothetical protein